MPIAVSGCRTSMLPTFPVETPENAGNMIHARAPIEMFSGTLEEDSYDPKTFGGVPFSEYVNQHCTHLVVTIANLYRVGDEDGTKYERFQRYLEKFDVPLVIFGLGAQAKSEDLTGATMPTEAVSLMRYLESEALGISVRGRFTKQVIEHFTGTTSKAWVTGCPSFFSRPREIERLFSEIKEPSGGRLAYSGTVLHEDPETAMLESAIRSDSLLVEPVNRFNHQFFLDSVAERNPEAPWYLRRLLQDDSWTIERLREYYVRNYSLFRTATDWYAFNKSVVAATYGTRFHVNMASLLSGKPATWITHDSRTRELCETLSLPYIDLNDAHAMSPQEIAASADYAPLFDSVAKNFSNFNEFLASVELPQIASPWRARTS